MTELDPGHKYIVRQLDNPGPIQVITFVKREGEGYPMNEGHYPGTTSQELLKVVISRTKYVSKQAEMLGDLESVADNAAIMDKLREAIIIMEKRAARRHGRKLVLTNNYIELERVCMECNHVQCSGECRTKSNTAI